MRAFNLALQNSKSGKPSKSLKCDFCEKDGQTGNPCFLSLQKPSNKLSRKILGVVTLANDIATTSIKFSWLQYAKANPSMVELTGSIVERTTSKPSDELRKYAEIPAIFQCFQNGNAILNGSIKHCKQRVVMLANDASVNSSYVGEVILEFKHVNL